LGDE